MLYEIVMCKNGYLLYNVGLLTVTKRTSVKLNQEKNDSLAWLFYDGAARWRLRANEHFHAAENGGEEWAALFN